MTHVSSPSGLAVLGAAILLSALPAGVLALPAPPQWTFRRTLGRRHAVRQYSDKQRIQWTIERVAQDVLHVHVKLYDDEAFTEPVVTTNIWHRMSGPGWQVLDDGSCFENNQDMKNSTPDPGFTKF